MERCYINPVFYIYYFHLLNIFCVRYPPKHRPNVLSNIASLADIGWRLADFVSQWLHATDDAYILRMVQRGHPVRVLAETPSCGVSDTHQPECIKGGRVMPPCGGDGQQGGPRTGPTTISRLLQQPLLGAIKFGGPEAGINLKPLNLFIKKVKFISKSIYTS